MGNGSAREYATRLLRRHREAVEIAGRFGAVAPRSRALADLLTLTGGGWRMLISADWPDTVPGTADLLMVGPGGVYAIDVADGAPDADGLRAMTERVEEQVSALGLSPIAVRPLVVSAGPHPAVPEGRVRLLRAADAVRTLTEEPKRLTAPLVRTLAGHLAEAFPGHRPLALPETPKPAPDASRAPLFDVEEVEKAALRAALDTPIERWMTFLHPDQVAMARRNWNGPARISGPAGTGKTVVGLHRAAYLAERVTGRVLYVTFVNNLPRVQGKLFQRLSPATAGRVEFTSLHAWASAFLVSRDVPVRLSGQRVEHAYSMAWKRVGRDLLSPLDPSPRYWHEEIDHVIKGRGLETFDEYRTMPRHGRRTALQAGHREAVWRLYEEYQRQLRAKGAHDFNDILALALEEVRRESADPPYAAVVVDEVQDLTLTGVRLLHALVGDAPNGLLLIGDGQQAVYPGGFRLADAGIAVTGRGGVLRTNYRNAAPILDAAMAMVSDDPFDDLEGTNPNGRRDVDLTYHEGTVVREEAADAADHDRLLIEALNALPGLADAAVLCQGHQQLNDYQQLLARENIPYLRLEHYDGTFSEAVKLGTFRRAKGLEFKQVFLPHHDATTSPTKDGAADRERAELSRRQLFVAMTRARDHLWLGSTRPAT